MPSSQLHRLIYYSKNRIIGSPETIRMEIDSILAASRRKNLRAELTGALVFNSGIFAQVMEGARDRIEATFEKIQQDERHGDLQLLGFEQVEERVFPRWSMAYFGRSREGNDLFGDIRAATGFSTAHVESARIFQIIRDIAIEEEGCAA